MTTIEIVAVSGVGGAVVGALLMFFLNKKSISDKKKRDAIGEFRKVFEDLFWEIKNTDISLYEIITNLVYNKFPITDKAVGVFLRNVGCKKRKEINIAYNNYKTANNVLEGSSQDMLLSPYCFDESKLKEAFGEKTKFKTGKELLLHNLQEIIDLAK